MKSSIVTWSLTLVLALAAVFVITRDDVNVVSSATAAPASAINLDNADFSELTPDGKAEARVSCSVAGGCMKYCNQRGYCEGWCNNQTGQCKCQFPFSHYPQGCP